MNDNLENHLNRAEKVSLFLGEHASELLDSLAALKIILDTQKGKILDDDALATVDNTGYTAQKDLLGNNLENSTIKFVDAIVSYADDANDFVLLHMAEFPPSAIQKFRDNRLVEFGRFLYTKATVSAVSADLINFHNITAGDITDFDANINAFRDYIAQPREKIGERSAYTGLVLKDFDDLNHTLDKIRRKMNTYRTSNATLFAIFVAADHIDDTGSSGSSPITGSVAANNSLMVVNITYDAATTVKLTNSGLVSLEFSVKQNGSAVAGSTTVTVPAGNITNTTIGAMAASGNELWVNNTNGATGNYEVIIG